MSRIDWIDVLGWNEEQITDLRLVGYSYLKQGHYSIALKFFEGLNVINRENAYDTQTLGALYLQIGNHLKALDYIEKALKLDPYHEPTLMNRAKVLFALGYKFQAITQARELEKSATPVTKNCASALLQAYS